MSPFLMMCFDVRGGGLLFNYNVFITDKYFEREGFGHPHPPKNSGASV